MENSNLRLEFGGEAMKRHKTTYPGVYYREAERLGGPGKERVYYIVFKKDGKVIEEKVGRQFADDMTPARAAKIRGRRIEGKEKSRKEKREEEQAKREAEKNRWTFDRLWEEYQARKPGLKGMVTDANRYANHLRPVFGGKEPQGLVPLDLDRLRLKLLKTHKPGTVKNVLELLRRLVNFAAKKHLCPVPSFIIEMPKVNNLKTEDLNPEQLAALVEAIDRDPNLQAASFMKMALYTGMRRGELFRLQWPDVDFDRGFIHIRTPKGGQDQKIPLNQAARGLLEAHPRTGSPFVFPGRGGRRRTDINKQVNRIKEAAGLPKEFRALHGLRHVYASMLASSGQVELYTLQKLLTHKSAAMTQRYAHLRDDALRRASDLAGDLLGQVANGKPRKIANLEE
ncbi:MAG: tyrosine-type recombinase/integrase [Thermodesulfobacteriota bacterium]